MLRLFYITFFCFLFIACNQTGTEKNYIKNLEEKNQILEKELQDLKNNKNSNNIDRTSKQKGKISKDYFTIGSTEDEVIEIMGDPTSYNDLGNLGKIFRYGYSTITFDKGKVESYSNIDGNLKVKVK